MHCSILCHSNTANLYPRLTFPFFFYFFLNKQKGQKAVLPQSRNEQLYAAPGEDTKRQRLRTGKDRAQRTAARKAAARPVCTTPPSGAERPGPGSAGGDQCGLMGGRSQRGRAAAAPGVPRICKPPPVRAALCPGRAQQGMAVQPREGSSGRSWP